MKTLFHGTGVRKRDTVVLLGITMFLVVVWTKGLSDTLLDAYSKERSPEVRDRNGVLLHLSPNARDQYMVVATGTERFKELAIRSEDRLFYYHMGFNPYSIFRALILREVYGANVGGSTITQQLTKNLLRHENDRTLRNKLIELAYAVALEVHVGKDEILNMYLNTSYFGDRIEGVELAAQHYFGNTVADLTDDEIIRLLATTAAPAFGPRTAGNTVRAQRIAQRAGVADIADYHAPPRVVRDVKQDSAMFELDTLIDCGHSCTLSVDRTLTDKIRRLVRERLSTPQMKSVSNATVAVVTVGKEGENNRLLALVGSPNPNSMTNGSQINMALQPRPIGSTWKPFIYAKAIEKGARPYSIINDVEYRYQIGTGYAFYPKNYDGVYRGPVTMNYALSNSLNVPAVRALQFFGITEFGEFMEKTLTFLPRQAMDTYQLSIALGGLEMNPLLLAHYFTIFPREGILAPLTLTSDTPIQIPMQRVTDRHVRIFSPTTTQMVTRMLTDRLLGVEEFGVASNLDLPFTGYAVKTGTSYDYHDSWTVGYTPDIVVAVWIGNSDNKPMDMLSGARGAGKIWHDVMALLHAEGEIMRQEFDLSSLAEVATPEGDSFGLAGDDVAGARMIFLDRDLIIEPHDGDVLLFQPQMSVPLRSTESMLWTVNGERVGVGKEVFWQPRVPGRYELSGTFREHDDTHRLVVTILEDDMFRQ